VLLWLFVAVQAGATESPTEASPAAIGLEGEWYVLVHYRDENAADPRIVQWRDRVWRFERERRGSDSPQESLRWTILDGVTFRDPRGRFEELDGGRSARSLGAWQPDAAQLAEIREGLRVDDQAARSKTLRRSPQGGYRSSGARSPRSSSTIGYEELWAIEGPPGAPVFVRDDAMGAGRTDELLGRTRFTTREVARDGDELEVSGDFEQDGELAGQFRMLRMGEPDGGP
jgi:hypothetical protein